MAHVDKRRFVRLIALLLFFTTGPGPLPVVHAMAETQAASPDGLSEHYLDAQALRDFYDSRDNRPVWLRGGGTFQPRAKAVITMLEDSWSHGLNPENYHIARLRNYPDDLKMGRVEFDMLLSDAVVRFARDLTGMRGKHKASDRSGKYWRTPMEASEVLEKVALAGDPVAALRGLAPGGKLYQSLRAELMALAAKPDEAFERIKIGSTLKPGQSDKAVPALRARFGLVTGGGNPALYDDRLAAEIIRFQRRNGRQADGVIRADTLAALNRSRESRMTQVIVNLERLRWMEQGRPGKYVLVNIPSASLWAVERSDVALEMPVVIGKTARPTYSFKTEISGVRFNPDWTVPTTIKNDDFLPLLRDNPLVLTERGIRITYKGQLIDPTKVDWSTVTARDLAQVKMIQDPGDDNPLGKVRVIMENPYNIYLHDTNHREVFDKSERALSSGCIRVAEPEKLADFILRGNDGWDWGVMQKIIASGRMRNITAQEKIPVYITYQTLWLDSEGSLIYGPDVYGQDARLADILKKADGIHIPEAPLKKEITL